MTILTIKLTVCCILCWSVQTSDGLRILGLFPLHLRSHSVISEELMQRLAAKGHHVDVYSHFPLKKPPPRYRDFSLKGSVTGLTNNLVFNPNAMKRGHGMLTEFISDFGHLCKLFEHPLFQPLFKNRPSYDLIITGLAFNNCFIAWGRYLNAPVIGIVSLSLFEWQFDALGTPTNLATDPGAFSPYVAPMTFWERLNNVISHYRVRSDYSEIEKIQNEYVKKFFGPDYPSVTVLEKEVALALVNHDPVIGGLKPFAPKVIPVGGLHIIDHNRTLPRVIQDWLDDSIHGAVYVSFGSMTRIETFPKHIINIFYESFKKVAPVRILMKIAKPEELAPGLPTNVLTQSWMPQTEIFKHKNVKAFVTHGGLLSTMESIHHGIPFVGIPLYGDQFSNIKSYAREKAAIIVNLNELTEKDFTDALDRILKDPDYKNKAQILGNKFRDRPMSPMDTAIYWVEYIHRHGRDALKSPIVDMPWWQASLLDVYGFLAIITVVAVYVALKLTKMLFVFLSLKSNSSTKMKQN